MKKIFLPTLLMLCLPLALTACRFNEAASIGIIGGSDGPTAVYVSDGKSSSAYADKYFKEHYIDINSVSDKTDGMEYNKEFTSADRTLALNCDIKNTPELLVYNLYRNMTSGSYDEILKRADGTAFTQAIKSEKKSFEDGLYFSRTEINSLELLDDEELKKIPSASKEAVINVLNETKADSFAIVKAELNIRFNEKYRNSAPQIYEGDITRYYLIEQKSSELKICEVFWDDFIAN